MSIKSLKFVSDLSFVNVNYLSFNYSSMTVMPLKMHLKDLSLTLATQEVRGFTVFVPFIFSIYDPKSSFKHSKQRPG